eukprot:GHVT01080910.1.p1 GENE.GHVT01080910.1~~GHVT01080910.1.p1  ORF type:complete len:502 (-),score=112.04 GHVT01080910.1:40-1545(-)
MAPLAAPRRFFGISYGRPWGRLGDFCGTAAQGPAVSPALRRRPQRQQRAISLKSASVRQSWLRQRLALPVVSSSCDEASTSLARPLGASAGGHFFAGPMRSKYFHPQPASASPVHFRIFTFSSSCCGPLLARRPPRASKGCPPRASKDNSPVFGACGDGPNCISVGSGAASGPPPLRSCSGDSRPALAAPFPLSSFSSSFARSACSPPCLPRCFSSGSAVGGFHYVPRRARGDYNLLTGAHVDELSQLVRDPSSQLLVGEDCGPHRVDWLNYFYSQAVPGAVPAAIFPRDVEELRQVVAYCHDHRLAVCPQGGNTGLVGGSVPVYDELVVNLAKMNAVVDFCPTSGVATVEAGCVLQALESFLLEQRPPHTVPVDLGAKGSCHIGGNVATNAGGIRLLRYGSMHANVLGLEAVTGRGRVLRSLSTHRKDNTGLKLHQLLIGSYFSQTHSPANHTNALPNQGPLTTHATQGNAIYILWLSGILCYYYYYYYYFYYSYYYIPI